jgi:DNA polymerase-3 subunit gamma/tau
MSYQVLARKWRPEGFDEVVGQAHVTTALRNAIRSGRVAHAILLTGPRGVGKTTLARILARCLNCDKGPTDTPCGECPPCREIAAGTSTDVQEIDAASRTSVEDVRELISAIRYAAAPGKHRIFVVDEVHMLSAAAFNALLKTLEEPPPRSLFVFATTNPEKIPFTVLSRCQRHDLRRIAASEIAERLTAIARAEEVAVSPASLLAIAREADGSLRDAQTLLDQVIAYGGEAISDEQVASVLDLIDRRVLLAILAACVDGDPAAALAACAKADARGTDAKRLSEHLVQGLRDLVVLRIAPDHPELVEATAEDVQELAALANRTDATRLRRMFRALVKEQEDLAWAPQPFAVLEMALVRLATLPAGDDVARLVARLERLEEQLGGSGSGGGGGQREPAPPGGGGGSGGRRSSGRDAAPAAPERPPGRHLASAASDSPAAARAPIASGPAPSAPAPTPRTPSAATSESPAAPPALFDRLRAFARAENPGIYAALEGGRVLAREDGALRIGVPAAFAARRLREKAKLLDALAGRFFGAPVRVEIADESAPSAAEPAAKGVEQNRQRRQDALNDPGVSRALEILGGEIVEIRPLGAPPTSPGERR